MSAHIQLTLSATCTKCGSGVDVRKELSIACCECLNCTGGKVGILSAAPLSLPSQELNINHMRRKKVVLIKLQRYFNVRISVSDGYQLRKKIKEASQDSTISRKTTSSNNTNGSSTYFAGISAMHTRASCYTVIPALLMSPKMQVKRK